MDSEIGRLFVAQSVKELRQKVKQIQACVARLSDDQIWSRGAPHENSVGNLMLHLCGNMRQWIVSGVGGEPDFRDRDSEFAASGGISAADLMARLNSTVEQTIDVIEAVTPERLLAEINPQDGAVSVLGAIYHVVAHFQLHAGQIIFATKIYAGESLGLYRPQAAAQ